MRYSQDAAILSRRRQARAFVGSILGLLIYWSPLAAVKTPTKTQMALTELSPAAHGTASALIQAVKQVDRFANATTGAAKCVGQKTCETSGKAVAATGKAMTSARKAVGPQVQKMSTALGEVKVFQAAQNCGDRACGGVKTGVRAVGKGTKAAATMAGSKMELIANSSPEAVRAAGSTATHAVKATPAALRKAGDKSLQAVQGVPRALSAVGTSGAAAVGPVAQTLKVKGQAAFEGVGQAASRFRSSSGAVLKTACDGCSAALRKVPGELEAASSKMQKALDSALKAARGESAPAIKPSRFR